MNKVLSKIPTTLHLSGASDSHGMTATGHTVIATPSQKASASNGKKAPTTAAPAITSHSVNKAPARKAHLPNPIGHLKITRQVIEKHREPKNQKELEQYKRLIQYYINFLIHIDHIVSFGPEKKCAVKLAEKKLTKHKNQTLKNTICNLLESLEFIIDNETDERVLTQVGSIKGCEGLVAPLLKASVLDYTLHQIGNVFRLKHNILYGSQAKTDEDIQNMLGIIATVDAEFSVNIRTLMKP